MAPLASILLLVASGLSVVTASAIAHTHGQPQARSDDFHQLSLVFPGASLGSARLTADQLAVPTRSLSNLLAHLRRPPAYLDSIYQRAGSRYGIPWQVLAAINAIETKSGRDLTVNPAIGLGWMRFVPATWQIYGISAHAHSDPVPYDPNDAILTAARFLAASGARHDLPGAIFAYNNDAWYVEAVLQEAAKLGAPASWQHVKLKPSALRSAEAHPAASSITLAEALSVARSSSTSGFTAADAAASMYFVPGALVPQASWNPQLKPIAAWIVPVLQWAFAHGWTGVVTSGYRTYAEQAAINALGLFSAPAGSSNHESTAYPGGAVDVTQPAQLSRVLQGYPGPLKLIGGVLGPVDPEHFSATGH